MRLRSQRAVVLAQVMVQVGAEQMPRCTGFSPATAAACLGPAVYGTWGQKI